MRMKFLAIAALALATTAAPCLSADSNMKNLDFDLSKVTRDNFYDIVVPAAKAEGAVTMYNFAGSFADTWKELITRFEAKYGIKVAYTPIGIMIAMCFTSLPFIVRTVQPVLEDLDPALEEAAQSLGGSDIAIFRKVILPLLTPALLAGVSLSFARSLGEFGAIIFIAGNQPMSTEITALLIFIRLEEYDYQAAAAIASVLLLTAFLMLAVTNWLQARAMRYTRRS